MKKFPSKGENGVTLVELLAALAISAVVVTLASRIFLSSNQQFLARALESDRLKSLYLLKATLQNSLRTEMTRCESGQLWLRVDGAEKELLPILKTRFSAVQSADFLCWEKTGGPISLVPWKDAFQPALVEYRIVLSASGTTDTLMGSLIK